MKVALVHDWLTGMRGGEKCLEIFCEIFPQAHLYTLLHVPGSVSSMIENMDIRTSALQRFPFVKKKYRYYLPLIPLVVEMWDTGSEAYDLILSSSHCAAKAVKFRNADRRVCYCFTPMRYLWCQTDHYYSGEWKQQALKLIRTPLKKWDLHSNSRVDEFIGISKNVSDRIHRFYGREAATIYPPVDTEFYHPNSRPRKDFYLVVGALEPYKRVDLALDVFRSWNRPLKIVGKGTMLEKLQSKAPPHVEFLGWKSDEEIRELYRTARALIFPGEEDFGIVPLEAQACACPVIAYGAGGILETVKEKETGLFFNQPTAESLLAALKTFERMNFNSQALRLHAESFGKKRFRQEMEDYLFKG